MASRGLGTLTLDLVARTSGFVQGMDKSERASKKWRKQVEKDVKTVARVSGAAIGATAAATAALVVQQVRAATEISNMAQMAGSGTTEFQRYAAAADVVGISQEKLSDQLKDFNEKVGEFQQSGAGGMKDFFEQIAPQIGITADAFRDLSGPQALQLYYDSLEKAGLSQQQMSFYLESMASDTTALIPLLRNGGEGFKLLGDEAERAGAIMSEDVISSTERLSAAMFVAENSMKGFRNDVSERLLPVLGDLAVEFSNVAEEGVIADDVGNVLSGSIKVLAASAVGAFAALQLLGRGIAGIAVIGGELTESEWYEKVIPPLLARRIYKNWDDAKQALDVVGDDLDDTAQRYGEMINNIWNAGDAPGGSEGGESTIDRIAKLRKEMRELSAEMTGGGGTTISEEAKKAEEAIAKEISALERAAATWGMSANEVKLYGLEQDGATDAQLQHAKAIMENIDAMEQQAEAAKKAIEDQKRINQEAQGIAESLQTEEESIRASYKRRRQIILDNTKITGEAQAELLRRLEEERNEQLLEINGSYWDQWLEAAEKNLMNFGDLSKTVIDNFSTGFGNAIEGLVFDAESLDAALKGVAETILRGVVNSLAQMVAQWLALQAVQAIVGTQATAATVGQAAIAAGAWAPAAAAASLATLGTNSAPAAGALASTHALSKSLSLTGMAHDGIDSVPKTGTWLLEKGERVMTSETSKKLDQKLDGGSGVVVNLYEDASKAGQVQQGQRDDGTTEVNVFVSDIMSNGPRAKAMQRAYGLRRQGA